MCVWHSAIISGPSRKVHRKTLLSYFAKCPWRWHFLPSNSFLHYIFLGRLPAPFNHCWKTWTETFLKQSDFSLVQFYKPKNLLRHCIQWDAIPGPHHQTEVYQKFCDQQQGRVRVSMTAQVTHHMPQALLTKSPEKSLSFILKSKYIFKSWKYLISFNIFPSHKFHEQLKPCATIDYATLLC